MNRKASLKIFETPLILAEAFAKEFKIICDEFILKNGFVNVALSGGNTPKLLFEILAKNYISSIDWKRINFYWVDERCVNAESNESNYGETERILFSKINIQNNIHRITGENDPEEEALRYSGLLKSNLPEINNFPKFDLVLLGMGDDGHTASIFPDQLNLLESDKICEVAVHPSSGQKRITLTGKVINNSEKIIFLITGKSKAEVIKDIFENKNESDRFPAAHIKSTDGEVIWYLDEEAGSLLNQKF